MVIAGVSVASLVAGVILSYVADAPSQDRRAMETSAGVLLIIGFGLLGYLLGVGLGAP